MIARFLLNYFFSLKEKSKQNANDVFDCKFVGLEMIAVSILFSENRNKSASGVVRIVCDELANLWWFYQLAEKKIYVAF